MSRSRCTRSSNINYRRVQINFIEFCWVPQSIIIFQPQTIRKKKNDKNSGSNKKNQIVLTIKDKITLIRHLNF